jgi:hypothetical protein
MQTVMRRRSCARPEPKGSRLLEQARHQATELTNSALPEVEQTLEWARAQATAILSRAQTSTEQRSGSGVAAAPPVSQPAGAEPSAEEEWAEADSEPADESQDEQQP